MAPSTFIGPAFRLVRTLDLVIDHGFRKLPVRVEIFQDPTYRTHFRYRVWVIEAFQLRPRYSAEPLQHEVLTTVCLPNLGAADYFEAADIDAAEGRFYDDFQRESGWARDA